MTELEKADVRALYEVVKNHPISREMIDWEAFGRLAEKVGLRYVEGLGLLREDEYRAIEPYLRRPE